MLQITKKVEVRQRLIHLLNISKIKKLQTIAKIISSDSKGLTVKPKVGYGFSNKKQILQLI